MGQRETTLVRTTIPSDVAAAVTSVRNFNCGSTPCIYMTYKQNNRVWERTFRSDQPDTESISQELMHIDFNGNTKVVVIDDDEFHIITSSANAPLYPETIPDEMVELVHTLKKKTDRCAICLRDVKWLLRFNTCGHTACETCFASLNKVCHICRRTFTHGNLVSARPEYIKCLPSIQAAATWTPDEGRSINDGPQVRRIGRVHNDLDDLENSYNSILLRNSILSLRPLIVQEENNLDANLIHEQLYNNINLLNVDHSIKNIVEVAIRLREMEDRIRNGTLSRNNRPPTGEAGVERRQRPQSAPIPSFRNHPYRPPTGNVGIHRNTTNAMIGALRNDVQLLRDIVNSWDDEVFRQQLGTMNQEVERLAPLNVEADILERIHLRFAQLNEQLASLPVDRNGFVDRTLRDNLYTLIGYVHMLRLRYEERRREGERQ